MKRQQILSFIFIVLLLAVAGCVSAPTASKTPETLSPMEIKNRMKEKFPQYQINRVAESEIPGVYELHGSNNIIYTNGEYLIIGHIITMDGQQDITQEKIDNLPGTPVEINTSAALTVKDGNGGKEIVMITDPECPYCSVADNWFNDGNANRKILFLPLPFHKNAAAISEHILCTTDPATEYKRVMSAMSENLAAKSNMDSITFLQSKGIQLKSCTEGKAQLRAMQAAIEATGITGTPMFIVDGKLIEGADPKLIELIK